jgi:hypothetical protein
MSNHRRASSFLGDLSGAGEQFLASQARRFRLLTWAFVVLLVVCSIVTVVSAFGLFGTRDRYLAWSGVFWILFCMAQIALGAVQYRAFRRELERRRQASPNATEL